MTLNLPLRKVGNSLMITIPQTLIEMYDITVGNEFAVEIDPVALILKCEKGGGKKKIEGVKSMTVLDKLEGVTS
jgi:antitoxin component of MazEF toxin-antitoxin module